jgi:DNA polymerase-1
MFDKKFLKQVIDSLGNEDHDKDSRVLIVDSMNTFIRNFSMINTTNLAGHHIGGLVGYLKSLGHAIRLFRPTRIILVFDGKGSTTNKKNLYPEYKSNRNTGRITNWDVYESKAEESQAMVNQMTRLIQYLNQLPVSLISVDKIEADDSIGFIVNYYEQKPKCQEITILSSDKDFYQLISKKTKIYSPTKKKIYKTQDVMDEFGVHPNNFLLYKTILGDTSDTLPGVRGLGPKKAIKFFPLSESKEYNLDEMFNICEDKKTDKGNIYNNVLEFKHQLKINYQLMNLRNPTIPDHEKENITNILNEDIHPLNTGGFLTLYEADGLNNSIPNTYSWLTDNFGSLILK